MSWVYSSVVWFESVCLPVCVSVLSLLCNILFGGFSYVLCMTCMRRYRERLANRENERNEWSSVQRVVCDFIALDDEFDNETKANPLKPCSFAMACAFGFTIVVNSLCESVQSFRISRLELPNLLLRGPTWTLARQILIQCFLWLCVCFLSLCKWNGYNYGTANTVLAALPSDVYCASQRLGRKKR